MKVPVITQKPSQSVLWQTAEFTHGVVLHDITVSPPWIVIALCRSLERAKQLKEHDPYMFEDELRILDLSNGELIDEDARIAA